MRLPLIAVLVASVGCGADSPAGPSATPPSAALTTVTASGDWPASAPEAEGLDRARLGDLMLRIRRGDYGRIASVLIARHGRLAVEEYFNGWSAEQSHTMQSVTRASSRCSSASLRQPAGCRSSVRSRSFFRRTSRSPMSTSGNRR